MAITPAEYETVMAAVTEPNFHDLLELAWETGARVQELRNPSRPRDWLCSGELGPLPFWASRMTSRLRADSESCGLSSESITIPLSEP